MPTLKKLVLLITGYFFIGNHLLYAQKVPYLDRLVTLPESKQSLSGFFKIISSQTSVVFSYTSSFNDKQEIKYKCRNKPLRTVLNDLLQSSGCYYRLKDRYIIIKCAPKPQEKKVRITGYIYSAKDSSLISDASIYIKQLKQASISNKFGFFELSITPNYTSAGISIAKENFRDTAIIFQVKSNQNILVFLNPVTQFSDTLVVNIENIIPQEIEKEKLDTSTMVRTDTANFWKRLRKKNVNIRNINDTLFTRFSISFLPNIGTNNLLSINTKNRYALNILGGYSKGIDRFELAGLFNIDNGNVKYGQIGGLGNIVAGNMLGVQVGGLFNSNSGQMKGVQIGGLLNLNKMNLKGVGIAGIGNLVNGKTNGLQLGGIFNYNVNSLKGVQVAGILNYSNKCFEGVQLGGIVNYSKNHKGLQVTSIGNTTDSMMGVQVTTLFNKATYVKGVQFAMINISDTIIGLPIGLFSYVKKGYHKIEVGVDELGIASLSFGTGVNKLHNIFLVGVYAPKPEYLTFGYGLGSEFRINKKLKYTMSATTQQIQSTQNSTFNLNALSKLFTGFEYQLLPRLSLGGGPTLSLLSSDIGDDNYIDFYQNLPTYSLEKYNSLDVASTFWVGAKVYFKLL